MKETSEILAGFEQLREQGKPAALATVIAVSGSAYRRPGARMLIAEDGRSWGGVSGGCLERDVARRGRGVIDTGNPVICRYDTTDDENLASGVATGCRGTVDLFIEPLSATSPGPLPALRDAIGARHPSPLATVVRCQGANAVRPGARLTLGEVDFSHAIDDPELRERILAALRSEPSDARPHIAEIQTLDSTIDVFIESLIPPQELLIFGGGPDAAPLVEIARTLGWRVTVIAAQASAGIRERFAHADALHLNASDNPFAGVEIRPDAAVVLMTHNYPRDMAILSGLKFQPRYLGILGPRRRTEQLIIDLRDAGGVAVRDVYAPIGLDIGAETSEQIALAIAAEIQAAICCRGSGFLRDHTGPIHSPSERDLDVIRPYRNSACPI
ncbi:MAG TPA: XdhC family protein [Tepidisphaeraceae bacterium]|jgi:xanthine/CO dehydrogenase XdhC/CoxF family maturation factor|nr:XdhC family protein [Tepidisphaeraceae bacterium]